MILETEFYIHILIVADRKYFTDIFYYCLDTSKNLLFIDLRCISVPLYTIYYLPTLARIKFCYISCDNFLIYMSNIQDSAIPNRLDSFQFPAYKSSEMIPNMLCITERTKVILITLSN